MADDKDQQPKVDMQLIDRTDDGDGDFTLTWIATIK